MSRLLGIYLAASPREPMAGVAAVRAVAGRGLEGDRYFSGEGTFSPQPMKPDFEVTLIEQEALEAFSTASGKSFTAADARRNLVTTGVRLNGLVALKFWIGEVLLQGCRLCEPCTHLARISFPEVLPGLVHRGGLRARILGGGILHVGDPVVPTLAMDPDEADPDPGAMQGREGVRKTV